MNNPFRSEVIIEPTKQMLERSIKDNIFFFKMWMFMLCGLLTIYSIYYVRTGQYAKSLFDFAIFVSIIMSAHFIISKIEKARLEIYKATHEE